MDTKDFISVQMFCTHYNIPVSFINTLSEFELIEIVFKQETRCVSKHYIKDIEKMMRLHFDLDINIEGIDVIYNLLKQLNALQEQVTTLSNKLEFYEHKEH